MATTGPLEDRLRTRKLALCEAFEIAPDKTASNISVDEESATFKVFATDSSELEQFRSHAELRYEGGAPVTVIFPASGWDQAQQESVSDYLSLFR